MGEPGNAPSDQIRGPRDEIRGTRDQVRGPRYHEIAEHLRGLVAGGEPGDRLPSDAELCELFGVSRMTARHAVQVLANEGLLYRRRGQGTFVASRPIPRLLGSPLSFTTSMRRRGLRVSSRVLRAAMADPQPGDTEALRLGDGERVVLVERLRLAEGVPMAIEHAVLVPDLEPVLDENLDEISLHAVMERLGRVPSQAQARVSARLADGPERRLLGSGVLLCERRVIADQDGVPIEHTETRYAAERYVFEVLVQGEGDLTL
jgi:GntR family transcriptional regulator